jgi:hypothetical protein
VEHSSSGNLVVGFFLVAAAAQLGGAVWLATVGRSAASPVPLAVAVAGTAALLLLYVVAHSSTLLTDLGLVPVGHDTGGGHGGGHDSGAAGHATVSDGPVPMGGELIGAPEPATSLGTATVAAQVLGLIGLMALLPRRWRTRAGDALAAAGLAVWLLWFAGVLS